MSEPNYDSRLELRRRQRDEEEIKDVVRDEYRAYLKNILEQEGPTALLNRLSMNEKESQIENIIEACIDEARGGYADKDFMKYEIDLEEIQWEWS